MTNQNSKKPTTQKNPTSLRLEKRLIRDLEPMVRKTLGGTPRYLDANDLSDSAIVRQALIDFIELRAIRSKLENEIECLHNIISIEKIENLQAKIEISMKRLKEIQNEQHVE